MEFKQKLINVQKKTKKKNVTAFNTVFSYMPRVLWERGGGGEK